MAKLVYIDLSISNLKTNGNFNTPYASGGAYFNSLVFTKDGHLITHGVDYSIASTITSVSAIAGGSAGNILYQSALNVTDFMATPANDGNYFVTYTGTTPSLTAFNGYKLRLNLESNSTTWTNATGTDILNGTGIYAPTSSGNAGQILSSKGQNLAPEWKSLTSTGSGDALAIPTLAKVEELISTASTSLLLWQGDTASVPTTTATKVGYAWRASAAITLPAEKSVTGAVLTLEIGDILICTTAYSATNTSNTPKFTVAQTNWTGSAGTSALSWGTEKTLATIGGIAIKAELPANPNTDTTHNFYVGETGAKADTAVNAGTNVYLTTKLSSAASNDAGTNILGFKQGTGISIAASNTKLVTITNTGVTGYTETVTSTTTGSYTIGTLKINGNNVTVYGKDTNTNTWRNVYVNGSEKLGTETNTKAINFSAEGSASITYTAGGTNDAYSTIKISATNTWRDVSGYLLSGTSLASSATGIGTNKLRFGNSLCVVNSTVNDETISQVDLVWEEVSSTGTKTYHV